jgi:hypothetical protein
MSQWEWEWWMRRMRRRRRRKKKNEGDGKEEEEAMGQQFGFDLPLLKAASLICPIVEGGFGFGKV